MKTNSQPSLRSPKHKFSAQICFDAPIEGIGSVITVTADDLGDVEHLASLNAQGHPAHVTIKENKAEYPSFDWSVVSEYNLNKCSMMKTIIEITVEGFENATISEDEESWFIDLGTGLGEAEYPKCDFTLDQAIEDQINWKME